MRRRTPLPKPAVLSEQVHAELIRRDQLLRSSSRPLKSIRRALGDRRRRREDRRREDAGMAGVPGIDRRVAPRDRRAAKRRQTDL